MLRLKILSFLLLISWGVSAQNIYKSKDGYVKFYSHALLEDIEATTKKGSAALNIQTGEFAALIPMKSFQFAKSLMQEHFNENYLETEKFPTASFKGKIPASALPKPGASATIETEGELTIHGVTKKRTIPVTLDFSKKDEILAKSKFTVKLADYNIEIPKLVFQNIAEEVEVTIEFNLVHE